MMQKPQLRPCLALIKPYIPGKPAAEVERELGIKNVIKLASNENPLGPAPLALQALQQSLGSLHLYPDGYCYDLRLAIAGRCGIKPEQIVFGNGSDELPSMIAAAYISPGDEAVSIKPTFSEYEFAMCLMGGNINYVPLVGNDFRFDLEAVRAAITDRTRLVFICSPNNPTGSAVAQKELKRFLESLPPGVLVVLDEAYHEYAPAGAALNTLQFIREGCPLITLRTFSKIYGLAGLRIGYGIAPAPVIEDLNRVREPFNVNSAAQAAALAALQDEQHLQRSRDLVEKGKEQLARGLQELGLRPVPTQANFIFVDLRRDAKQVFLELMRRGVIVRSGDIFGFPTYIRVTIGTAEQNALFLEQLAAVLAG
jgi:histidinol-phosphate aminotransferase